jgi:Pentapeptide repeats (8 copies)
MAIEDKSQLPPFLTEDEKKVQQELDRLRKNKERGFEGKTLWDWLQLLGVPIFLAFATIGFGFVQFQLAGQQHDADQKLANQQHDADQKSALDQQHATTFQTYIDNIQELLLKDNLRGSKPDGEVAILARARTLAALEGLDSIRQGRLVQFLYEAQLIGFQDIPGNQQHQINDLRGANLSYTFLIHADLNYADLRGADLSYTYLIGATLTQQQLDKVYSCNGATLPQGLKCNNNP